MEASTRPGRGADENRARLLSIAAGGSGHVSPYLERVTLEGAPRQQATAYVYHNPARVEGGRLTPAQSFLGSFELCEKMYLLPLIEAADEKRREASAALEVVDIGRRIPAETWRKNWECLRELPAGGAQLSRR